MYSREIEEYKKKLRLSDEQKEVLIGLLLGDGCLETQNEGRTYRLKIEQSSKHGAYVAHLHKLFSEWVLSPPRARRSVSAGRESQNLAFQTVSHGAFRFFAHQFYAEGKKIVPKLIHRWMTPRSVAYWFMDDGSIKSNQSKAVVLNTQGFTKPDVERLSNTLADKFGLTASVRRQKDGCQIFISGKSYELFISLVSPYMIDEMEYKLPTPRRPRSTHLPKL